MFPDVSKMMYKIRLAFRNFEDTILAMKKFVWVLVGALTIISTPVISVRATPNQRGLLIAEIQTGSGSSASEEFIELYNQSEDTLDLSKYKIEYFTASATSFSSPSRTIVFSGNLFPNGRYLIASTGYLGATANASFSPTLAKTGGHLRVVSQENDQLTVDDLIGWGSATMPEGRVASAPNGGESLQRRLTSEGIYQDTDNNQEDFGISLAPSPEANNPQPPEATEPTDPTTEPPTESEPPVDTTPTEPAPVEPVPTDTSPEPPTEQPQENPTVLQIDITELLPNPGAPKTDADDEFIELYNPNNVAVNLQDYRLETGNNYSYHYVFGSITIEPHSYISITSKDSNLVLANSGGKARLLNPDGVLLSETLAYDQADTDMAWAFVNGSWQWTASPTPATTNLLVSPEVKAPAKVAAASLKKTAAPKAAIPKKSTAKVASAKTPKAKTSSAKTKAKAAAPNNTAVGAQAKSSLRPWILAVIGLLALGYAGYEYRADIANYFHKLRGFRKNRGDTGQSP